MKIKMFPTSRQVRSGESGIHTLVRKYMQYLPLYGGVDIADEQDDQPDLYAIHVGTTSKLNPTIPIVLHLHGLHFTGMLKGQANYQWTINADIINFVRKATEVTVPSPWIAEIFQRNLRFSPHIVPHAVDFNEWEYSGEKEDYIVGFAKNRTLDICDPTMSTKLAAKFPSHQFVMTFAERQLPNIEITGVMEYNKMKQLVQKAAVFVAPVKETWCIAALEAMAASTPVLCVNTGHTPNLVGHGVAGYCYEEGNLEDMARGLDYCLSHRKQLGENGRLIAAEYGWDKVIKELVKVYEKALSPQKPTVAVVVPVYNKRQDLARAVESVVKQTVAVDEIVIVDDGSTDDSLQVAQSLKSLATDKTNIKVLTQPNKGVAHARNLGVRESSSKYVVCLDADDQILPEFVESCVQQLESDKELGLVYTKLQWITSDGRTGFSEWPGEWDYDKFLKKKNQVPTCCMFKREAFDRLGGYRQRYAPTGAGAEDAELWLRFGAYGYKAKLINKFLFLYSWLSGHTSQNYQEPNWLEWHTNWIAKKCIPIASYQTPDLQSHPVDWYDDPDISIIIPTTADHAQYLVDAFDSVEAQHFQFWEIICVWDDEGQPPEWIQTAYPYVRWVINGHQRWGAGKARNLGVKKARGNMLLFLDADDMLQPEFLTTVIQTWNLTKQAVYTDYYSLAFIDDVQASDSNLQNVIVYRNPKTKETTISQKTLEYDCQRAIEQPNSRNPNDWYLWCNVTTLIPKSWHDEIGGFNEELPAWEDLDYWWRMAKAGKCFTRVAKPLMSYRVYSGSRRTSGGVNVQELTDKLFAIHKGELNGL